MLFSAAPDRSRPVPHTGCATGPGIHESQRLAKYLDSDYIAIRTSCKIILLNEP